MAEISTRAVMNGITSTLRGAYPDAVISKEEVTQGMEIGAFIVSLISSDQAPLLGRRYHREPMFEVRYFGDSDGACTGVADNLSILLETITTPDGDLLRGTGIDWRVEDNVLQFFVRYPYTARIVTEQDFMETLRIQEEERYD